MSLLGTQVFANPDTPIWLSTTGGTIDGNVTIDGSLSVNGNASADAVYTQDLYMTSSTGVTRGGLDTDGGGTMYVRAPSYITFAQTGAPPPLAGNTSLTLSAAGANLDLLSVGGRITSAPGGGITPFASIPGSSPQTVTLTTGTPSRVAVFPVTTPYPLLPSAEYDVQMVGAATWDGTGSAPAPGDLITISVAVGPSINQNASFVYYPGNAPFTWTSNVGYPFAIRQRLLTGPSPPANLAGQVNFLGNAATGNITATCSLLDVVRVA